ncbi:MAG TPA: peptidoglycan DD-metalloendopeptidase family protein [Firmicutes bacterium]|nr:peptidoglycan DD-metalloendopeptidase family protein [Bacillota bacterium]
MYSPKFRLYLAALLIFGLFATLILPAYAGQTGAIEERIKQTQREQNQIQRDLDARKGQLEEYQSEEKRLLAELNSLENSLEQFRRELDKLERDIQDMETSIEITEAELAEAERLIEQRDEFLKMRLRAIYEKGDAGYLEVLFQTSSFAEFTSRLNDLKLIAENDFIILELAYAERQAIQEKKEALEKEKEHLLGLKMERQKSRDELSRQMAEREKLMEDVLQSIEAQERAIRELEQEAGKVADLIKQLQEEMRSLTGNLTPSGKLLWPLAEYGKSWITSPYGYRTHPITKKPETFHGGVDIGIPRARWPGSANYNGSPVYIRAADNGVVLFADISGSLSSGYGRAVIISHGGDLTTVYGHCHTLLVTPGQSVSQGQPIAIVGSTGSSTGPHVHFEVRVGGDRKNPMNYF